MRFPDEDAYRYAGGLKRLWYKIICPFTFGARLWMVTTSILCALAVVQSANGPSGYHGSAQDTGFLSGNFVNGVRIAWEINAEDAGLDRIDTFRVSDEYIYLVGYKGAQRSVVAFDASYSTPRELWRTDINDDEEGVNWWGDDLLVGNTLVSTADGSTRSDWPTPGVRLVGSPYQHPSGEGPSTGPIGPVRLYCPTPSSAPCQAWDKTGTHVWDFDASTGSFPDSVTPLEGWVPLRAWEPSSAGPAMGYTLDELTGFLNLETGERVGLDAIEEACGPATLDKSSGEPYCRVTAKSKQQHLILRASDGWIVGDDVGYIATVAPDGSNPQVMHLDAQASRRLIFLRRFPDQGSAQTPTIEEFMHFAATGEASWDSSITVSPGGPGGYDTPLVINEHTKINTGMTYYGSDTENPSVWLGNPALSKDASVVLLPHVNVASASFIPKYEWNPVLVDVNAAADATSTAADSDKYAISSYAVPGWENLHMTSATTMFDDLIVGFSSPAQAPWYKRLAGLSAAPGERVVGLTPTHKASRSVR